MARYYSRAALPNELGRRLRSSGLLDAFKAALKGKVDGAPVHEGIDRLYVRWDAEAGGIPGGDELPTGRPYWFHVTAACKDERTRGALERVLAENPALARATLLEKGIDMPPPTVELLDDITLKQINRYTRLNDWDALSVHPGSCRCLA